MSPKLLLCITLVLTTFAGCVSEPAEEPDDTVDLSQPDCVEAFCGQAIVDETGRDLRTKLTANDTLDAPTWQVGDVFEQHIFYGSSDSAGEHIQTMVVDDSGDCYEVATTSENAAKFEAAFNLPVLGCLAKDDLGTDLFFSDWEWMYDFPLEDGKSWDAEMLAMVNWNDYSLHDYRFTLTANYDPAINTWTGDFPGFVITGITDEGEELLRYNYVPAVGWFSHLWIWDLGTEAPEDVIFHAMSMGTSKGYTGPYLQTEVTEIMQEQVGVALGNEDKIVRQFQVGDAQLVKGVIVPIACGTSKVVINTPSNTQHQYDHTFESDPDDCTTVFTDNPDYVPPTWYSVHWVEQAAEAGDYTMTVTCTGLCGYFAWLTAVTVTEHELVASGEATS